MPLIIKHKKTGNEIKVSKKDWQKMQDANIAFSYNVLKELTPQETKRSNIDTRTSPKKKPKEDSKEDK